MMKKAVIAIGIIGLFVLIYFVCSDSDDKSDSNATLMTSTAEKSNRGAVGTDDGEVSGSDVEEDNERGEETKKPAENTVSFSVRGEGGTFTFKSVNPFIKIARTSDMTGYVANFASDMNSIKVTDQGTYSRVLSMLIPSDVTPGTYNEKSSNFMFQYFGTESGVMYSIDVNYPFTLTIDEWGGSGGRARGSFSGELKVEGSNQVIMIQNGRFDAGIQ